MIRSAFARSAAALAGGTAGAQLIAVLALPILTRLYSPGDFALLAIYLAMLGMLASIACLRFEIAISLPEEDGQGMELLAASLMSVLLVATVTAITVLGWPHAVTALLKAEHFAPYLWLLPFGVLMAGLYASFQYWTTRKKRFGQVARSRIAQAGVGVGTQVGAGAASIVPGGLLVGHMLYGGAGAMGLALSTWRQDGSLLRGLSLPGIWSRIVEYRRFPIYSTLEALANSAAIQLPMILIAAYAVGPEAGFVLLATRVMGAPMQLIGSAISQAYLAHAPQARRDGHLQALTFDIIKPLALTAIPGMIVIALIAPMAFSLVFGEEWRRAGVLLQWMSPWFTIQFIAVPVSTILVVTGRQRSAMLLQLFGLLLRAGMVVMAARWTPEFVSEAYAVSGALFYAVYFIMIIWAARHDG